ncbi:hypothetical protein ACH4OW_05150 [Streptomyces sp. NPDC017056]|uniref:hypothetical protein n=1 Tax=Streptomyces sp. NPDC017056 TaxID=3364973 RepID=UPI0037938D21
MDMGAALIAIVGVAGTLGGALLTQRGADRTKRRELELSRAIQEAREDRELRRRNYTDLHRDARQFATALSRHLYVIRDRAVADEDVRALEGAKDAQRNGWSEAIMIAPGAVLAAAREVNGALTRVHGQVKRLEQGNPRPGETLQTAAEAQQALWPLIHAMGDAMRHDLGIPGGIEATLRDAETRHPGVQDDMPGAARTGTGRTTRE